MQEEVENRTVNLAISTTKLTFRTIVNGYNAWKRHHQAKVAQKTSQLPVGKQSIKELIGQNQGVSSIPIEKTDLKGFEQVARKYGVDYAITKDQNVIPPKYTVFFKAKDADALTSAFEEFTNRKLKAKEKPSVLEQLNKLKELVAAILPDKVRHKSQERDLMSNKTKKLLILNLPYFIAGLVCTNLGEAWRIAEGADMSEKLLGFLSALGAAFSNPMPSLHPLDLLIGVCCGAGLRLAVYLKGKNAKKYRHGMEYGSARWGTQKDIEPFEDPVFANNVILTRTERLMMGNRPKNPANARNKNVLVVGGSGSGKTRFWLKPNLLQCHSSYVVTDPKGDIVIDCGQALLKNGYSIRIFNTINFRKSMHYNPFAYIHSEKDILKLTTTLIANTKGDGKAGDEFWTKAETLLYCALIGYIHYEAPLEEQNFATLIEFLNAMEVREDDETFQNPVDQMFEALKKKKPNHFAVRQYAKFKLAAGDICSK